MNRTLDQERARDAERRASRERDEIQELADLRWLLRDPAGRRIAWRLRERGGLTAPLFNANAMAMSAEAGKRDFVLLLDAQLRAADFEHYLKMQKENDRNG